REAPSSRSAGRLATPPHAIDSDAYGSARYACNPRADSPYVSPFESSGAAMRPSHAVTRLALTVTSGIAALACGLSDVFRSPGIEQVTLTYQGPICIPVDSTEPFRVVVEAGSVRLRQPRLGITSSDSSVVEVTPGLDSLRGK